MTEEQPVSEEILILASIVGAAFAGIATEIKNKSPTPDPIVKTLFDAGLRRIEKNLAVLGSPEKKAAVLKAFRDAARI